VLGEETLMLEQEVVNRINQRLDELYWRHLSLHDDEVVGYYESGVGYHKPEVLEEGQKRFSICLVTTNGEVFVTGDHDRPFALQSISKTFVYGLALEACGRGRVLARVGVEPSGDAFNSIVFDERHHRPFNPMVNAGALATTDLVGDGDTIEMALGRILGALRRYAGNGELGVDEEVFEAELRTADRNRATAYLMRSEGMLEGDVEATLALYLQQCSVRVTCRELALMAATLANGGVNPVTGEQALGSRHVRDVLSVMHTCGMYDFAGEWGLPGGHTRQERGERRRSGGSSRQVRHRRLLARSRRLRQQCQGHGGVRRDLRTPRAARLRRSARRCPARSRFIA
jgi:glutaminase